MWFLPFTDSPRRYFRLGFSFVSTLLKLLVLMSLVPYFLLSLLPLCPLLLSELQMVYYGGQRVPDHDLDQ